LWVGREFFLIKKSSRRSKIFIASAKKNRVKLRRSDI
jgi:hypothetical protein